MRLLLIEDEARIVELLKSAFERAGFAVDAVGAAAAGEKALASIGYDAAILDLGLPDGDGSRLLAGIRSAGNRVPVLILTARDSIEDRVEGLDAGADDYLVKPFAVSELISRIKALLRRPGSALGTLLEAGNLVFDTIGRDVRVDTTPLAMPRHELAILEHLMRRLTRVVPLAVLEEKIYDMEQELESNALSVHVHHLTRKLTDCGAKTGINTVRCIG